MRRSGAHVRTRHTDMEVTDMNWQEAKEDGLKAFKAVIDAYLERGYKPNAPDEERTMILLAAEVWTKDIQPIVALIVLDALLDDGKHVETLLEYADGKNLQCYKVTANYIRKLALKKCRIDVHCGEGGFTAEQLSEGRACALLERIWQEEVRELHKVDKKLFPLS